MKKKKQKKTQSNKEKLRLAKNLGIVFAFIILLLILVITVFAGIAYKYYKTIKINDYLTPIFEDDLEKENSNSSSGYQNQSCSSCNR